MSKYNAKIGKVKIISWNVNGLRSVYRKGAFKIEELNADILCLQEIKAFQEQLNPQLINIPLFNSYFNSAQRKGYSGTAVYSRQKPFRLAKKMGLKRFDQEGRFMRLDYQQFTLINLYLPHGGRQKENLGYKLAVYDCLLDYLSQLKNKRLVLAGDFNVAHQEIDLARAKQNKSNIMFTPKERKRIDKLIKLGFVDSFRRFNQKRGNYTWWPYFANARTRNLGWRLDYLFVSENLLKSLKSAFILKKMAGSDHCPAGIEIDF